MSVNVRVTCTKSPGQCKRHGVQVVVEVEEVEDWVISSWELWRRIGRDEDKGGREVEIGEHGLIVDQIFGAIWHSGHSSCNRFDELKNLHREQCKMRRLLQGGRRPENTLQQFIFYCYLSIYFIIPVLYFSM